MLSPHQPLKAMKKLIEDAEEQLARKQEYLQKHYDRAMELEICLRAIVTHHGTNCVKFAVAMDEAVRLLDKRDHGHSNAQEARGSDQGV